MNSKLHNKDKTVDIYNIPTLPKLSPTPIKVRGYIHMQRIKSKFSFLILRQTMHTVQCIYTSNLPDYKEYTLLPSESFIEITGIPVTANIESCTIRNLEIQVHSIKLISKASTLPIGVKEASATHTETINQKVPPIQISKLLDNRTLHLRTFQCQAIYRIQSYAMHIFRDFLIGLKFIEIKTSKLIESASEGGSNVFEVKYFDGKAYLAQSPQLYKQMAVLGGFERVFEIGHVYRAEESNTNRYLSEFVGVDLEMQISDCITEVIILVYDMITKVFNEINLQCANELECVRAFRPFQDLRYKAMPVILDYRECVEMLEKEGIHVDGDFTRDNEKRLGKLIAERDDVDLFIIRNYPKNVRAFYTKGTEDGMSHSFDFIMRGEEILSGAERINSYEELIQSLEERNINPEGLKGYLNAFKYGVPRHGGCGIGFERVMKTFFDFDDIRYFNMFPREPTRLYP